MYRTGCFPCNKMGSAHDPWHSVEELYRAAIDHPPAERAAFLKEACHDPELRREVESLLAFASQGDSLLLASPWSHAAELKPKSVFGPYRIEAKIGAGGMGEVYRARDNRLARDVALKILPANMMSDAGRRARFIREAQSAARLNHPNIVTIYDIGDVDGRIFISMEYVDGKTVAEIVPSAGLTVPIAINYAVAMTAALSKAHAAGVIHRDLKPGNVMVTGDGVVKILDFGLAKLCEESPRENDTLTVKPETLAGMVMGTPAYMSPEQVEGRPVDTRSDVFSFGSLLYEMLTGKRAFDGKSGAASLGAVLHKEPDPLPAHVPGELAHIVMRCLRKDPEHRFQTMMDVRAALNNLQTGPQSGSAATNAVRVTAVRPGQRWGHWSAIAGGVALLALLGWFFVARNHNIQLPLTVRPLTTFPGVAEFPSFSPDGTQVAFDWNGENEDNFDIYVKVVDAGTPLRLTSNQAKDRMPAWSPDGRQIAFVRDSAAPGVQNLLLIPPLGGVERKLADITSPTQIQTPPAWTPDSKFLAVRDHFAVVLVSAMTGEKRKLTAPPGGWSGDGFPAISPDGRMVAFVRVETQPTGDIYIAPISDGTRARRLTFDNRTIGGLAWTPDGKGIVFSSRRAGDLTLWRIAVSGGAPERLPAPTSDANEIAFAPQGRKAAFGRHTSRHSFWRLDLGSEGVLPPPRRLVTSSRRDRVPQLSPDGRHIVFESDRSGAEEIWVCDSEGNNAVQLTNMGFTLNPWWSPDSRYIVFAGRPADRVLLFVIPADGGTPRQIVEGRNPSWSRDGRWIYFISVQTGTRQTWKIPSTGGTAIQLTRNGGGPGMESLDGRYFYYWKPQEAGGLWKVPVEGGPETLVTTQKLNVNNFFALRRQGLYFTEPRPAAHQSILKLLRFENGQSTPLAVLDQPHPSANIRLSVAADDTWLLYDQMDRIESDLMLIENFR